MIKKIEGHIPHKDIGDKELQHKEKKPGPIDRIKASMHVSTTAHEIKEKIVRVKDIIHEKVPAAGRAAKLDIVKFKNRFHTENPDGMSVLERFGDKIQKKFLKHHEIPKMDFSKILAIFAPDKEDEDGKPGEKGPILELEGIPEEDSARVKELAKTEKREVIVVSKDTWDECIASIKNYFVKRNKKEEKEESSVVTHATATKTKFSKGTQVDKEVVDKHKPVTTRISEEITPTKFTSHHNAERKKAERLLEAEKRARDLNEKLDARDESRKRAKQEGIDDHNKKNN